MLDFLTKVFGSKHDRDVKKVRPVVDEITAVFKTIESRSDDALRAKTGTFRDRLADEKKETREHLASLRGQLPGLEGEPRQAILDQVDDAEAEIKDIEADVLDDLLARRRRVVREPWRRCRRRAGGVGGGLGGVGAVRSLGGDICPNAGAGANGAAGGGVVAG